MVGIEGGGIMSWLVASRGGGLVGGFTIKVSLSRAGDVGGGIKRGWLVASQI